MVVCFQVKKERRFLLCKMQKESPIIKKIKSENHENPKSFSVLIYFHILEEICKKTCIYIYLYN